MIKVKLDTKNKLHLNSSSKVFTPTQTTFDLIDALKKNIKKKNIQIIDMGCGNGVIGIALLKLYKNITNAVFSDVSLESLKDCKKKGIKGVVLQSNKNIFLEKNECINFANKNKIFIQVL